MCIRLEEATTRYAASLGLNKNQLTTFQKSQAVANEVKDLRADRSKVSEHIEKLDEFVTEQLAGELTEFHEDKKSLVE